MSFNLLFSPCICFCWVMCFFLTPVHCLKYEMSIIGQCIQLSILISCDGIMRGEALNLGLPTQELVLGQVE